MSLTTKKLPIAIRLRTGKIRRNDFLVPQVTTGGDVRFVGLTTGEPALHGLLVYTGVAVSAGDLVERAGGKIDLSGPEEHVIRLLNRYIDALQSFRIGNVLAIRSAPEVGFQLEKVAERPPPFAPHPKLPG